MNYVIDGEELEAHLWLNLPLLCIGQTIEIIKDDIKANTKTGTLKYFPTGLFKIMEIRHRISDRDFGHFSPATQVCVYLEQIRESF
ncbi:MAG: hypothetical protein ACK41O_18325 [Runella zeae]